MAGAVKRRVKLGPSKERRINPDLDRMCRLTGPPRTTRNGPTSDAYREGWDRIFGDRRGSISR